MKGWLKRIVAVGWLLSAAGTVFGESPSEYFRYQGFSGGMMLHTGWVSGGSLTLQTPAGVALPQQRVQGMPYGIGGAIRFHFGNNFRIGTEGYVSHLNYGGTGSRMDVSWGGLLADWRWQVGRFSPYLGMTFGGGGVRNLTLVDARRDDMVLEEGVSYRTYSFMAVAPFVGVEFEMTRRMRLVLKADCLLNVSSPQPDFPVGPRIYFGFIFCHLNE